MICRLLIGAFGSSPLVVVEAIFTHIYADAMAVFASAVFMGPMVASIMGAFTITTSYLGWRWNEYWTVTIGFTTCVLVVLFQETYIPSNNFGVQGIESSSLYQ